MRITNHFKQRLFQRFKMTATDLEQLIQSVHIEHFNCKNWIPFPHLAETFKKYPSTTLICIEELNMCIVSDSYSDTLITVYKINN